MSKWSSNNVHHWHPEEKNDERDMNNNRCEHFSEYFPIRQSSRQSIRKQIQTTSDFKYENAYKQSYHLDLEDPERENLFFSTNKPIYVQIIDHEQESSLLVLQRTIYIIKIIYDSHEWIIRKRFKNFLKLYETFALFKAKQNIKNIANLHTGSVPHPTSASSLSSPNDVQVNQSKFKPTDHFKLLLQSIPSDFNHARNILEKFLQECADNTLFRNHNETLKFLEVSHLSFIKDLGEKNKEGMVKKHSFNAMCFSLFNFSFFWDSRWLVIKDTWIGLINPKTGIINQIMLIDQGFKVSVGSEQTGTRKGLIVENLVKTLLLKCASENQAKDWKQRILSMALTTGCKFFNTQRFQSFAPIREKSLVKWFVDAADYMESVADSIEAAKEEIFITGFFLSPEIYLKRPIIDGDRWRLDKLLQRKAEEGVKIYILIYKEIELTLPINSAYSKRVFTLIHKNIKVLRHPDHLNEPNKIWSIMWAHHEKLVIIDQSLAYFGGIDLCFGRWDNHLHKLTDMGSVLPNQESQQNLAQGLNSAPDFKEKKDPVQLLAFSNRKSNANTLNDSSASSDASNNQELPTTLGLSRKVWYKEKTKRYDLSYDNQIESDSEYQDDHLNRTKSLKRSKSLDISLSNRIGGELSHSISEASALPLTNRQILNEKLKLLKHSIKSNTHNIKLFREYSEFPILNQLKNLKDNFKRYKQKHFGDNDSEINSSIDQNEEMENKRFEFSSLEPILSVLQGSTKYWIGKDYCNFILKDLREVQMPFKDLIDRSSMPRMPWHDVGGVVCGSAARDIARHFIQRWNYIKQKKVSKNNNYPILLPKNYQNFTIPSSIESKCSFCRVQVLRSLSSWSAGLSKTETSIHEAMKYLIQTSKHYIYVENQFFVSLLNDTTVYNKITECLYERIVRAAREKQNFKVYVFIPLIPGYEGEYGKSSGVLLHAITHYNNSSINGLIKKLSDASIEALNYLCFFSMRNWAELNGKLVTELIYVHSKLMLVDDRACIIGSANINDRSLMGNRDSEVALMIEDTKFVKGIMNKKECHVGKFCSSLRHRLFNEFLGEFACNSEQSYESSLVGTLPRRKSFRDQMSSESIDISDPCSDHFYKKIMLKYAAQNTRIYDLVFKTIPCDYVSNFQQLKEYQKQSCLSQKSQTEAKLELSKIKGYIVLYPYRFLCFEDLTPQLGTKEKLMPSSLFT